MRLRDPAATVLVVASTFTVTAVAIAATTIAVWTIIATHASPAIANDFLSRFIGFLTFAAIVAGMFGYSHKKREQDDAGHASGTDS